MMYSIYNEWKRHIWRSPILGSQNFPNMGGLLENSHGGFRMSNWLWKQHMIFQIQIPHFIISLFDFSSIYNHIKKSEAIVWACGVICVRYAISGPRLYTNFQVVWATKYTWRICWKMQYFYLHLLKKTTCTFTGGFAYQVWGVTDMTYIWMRARVLATISLTF